MTFIYYLFLEYGWYIDIGSRIYRYKSEVMGGNSV